jgi:HlyD family secretion protein
MKKKKLFLAGLAFMLVGGAVAWYSTKGLRPATAAVETRIVTVDRGLVRPVVTATGKIAANNEVDIKCKASGEVINLPFDVSDVVKKGELVLQLDPIDEKRRVAQQEAALTAAKCRLSNAQQTLNISEQTLATDTRAAQAALTSAQINAKDLRAKAQRARQLLESKLISEEAAESAETAAARAENEIEVAKNTLEALKTRPITIEMNRNEVRLAEIAVESATNDLDDARQRLKETDVVAPIDGVVTTRPAHIGTIVSSGITNVGGGTSIMTLCDMSRLFVLVPVDEADIGRVKLDQKVVIKCDAFPEKKFDGKIIRIAQKGATVASVVTFEVKIEVLGEGKELLRPEMTTDVEIVIAHRENVLRVPSEAILIRDKTRQRYVKVPAETPATSPATATKAATTPTTPTTAPATAPATGPAAIPTVERDVEIGVDDGAHCEILGGLKEGDKVVIDSQTAGEWTKVQVMGD